MDEPPHPTACEIVRIGAENPIRMAAVTPRTGHEPMVQPKAHVSATPVYTVAIDYEWRRDEVMAGIRR
jgi:hypothetical protein